MGVRMIYGMDDHWPADWQLVDCENICWTIVESSVVIKVQLHGYKAVVTVETNLSGTTIFEAGLHPQGKDVTRLQNGLRGDNGLNRVLAVKTKLPMRSTI